MNNKKLIISILFLYLFTMITPFTFAQQESSYQTATIYYNQACSMCSMYIKQNLIPLLKELGIKEIIKKDYVNEKSNRIELNEINKELNIPPTLQGHFTVFIDDKIVLEGHVPLQIIQDLLTKNLSFEKILILQDEMDDDAKSYFAWSFKGNAKEYKINESIESYIDWFNENKETLKKPNNYESSWKVSTMLPLILSTGFLDGINPCALAVLLFFIAFLYTIQKTKASIWKMGIAYIFAIFISYFLIGLGLIKAFIFTGYPHLIAEIGGYLMITLGIVNIAGFLLPNNKRLKIGIPKFSKDYLKQWMYKSTVPASLVTGFLVGLCTFPCSGGMYVAIIGLLAAKTTYLQGMSYLIIYNIMFVMPLVIILVAASNKKSVEKIDSWEKSQSKILKLIIGIVMIALGLGILFWLI